MPVSFSLKPLERYDFPPTRPFVPRTWPEKNGLVEIERKRALREKLYLSSDRLWLRTAVEMFGSLAVPGWDGSEKLARWQLTKAVRPWTRSATDERDGVLNIYQLDGTLTQVTTDEAENWWQQTEPTWLEEWEREQEAFGRWLLAERLVRNRLAEGKLVAFVLNSDDGRTHEIKPECWHASIAGLIFYTGFAEIDIASVVTVYHSKGMIFLEKAAVADELERLRPVNPDEYAVLGESTVPDLDAARFPYLAFMLRATVGVLNRPGLIGGSNS